METTRPEAKKIIEILLALPWQERNDVWCEVRFNPIFCVECGYGDVTDRNGNCQCTNDE